jgi:hypothetical protein
MVHSLSIINSKLIFAVRWTRKKCRGEASREKAVGGNILRTENVRVRLIVEKERGESGLGDSHEVGLKESVDHTRAFVFIISLSEIAYMLRRFFDGSITSHPVFVGEFVLGQSHERGRLSM